MPGGDDNATASPRAALAFDAIAAGNAPHRKDRATRDDRRAGILRITLEERQQLAARHEPVGIVAAVPPPRQPVHPVWRQQPERIPALAAPALRHVAALQDKVLDAERAEAIAHGEP